jgi:putative ABC transport system permease protein
MFRNFFLIAIRNIIRDKAFLILNVLGLTLGIAGSVIILLYVRYELGYEKFHPNADRIYRIDMYAKMEGKEISAAITAPPQARVFKEEYSEIEDATRYYYAQDQKVTVNNVTYHEKRFFYTDANFLQLFNFPLEKGNPRTALENPFSVVITPETAMRLYGTLDVVGKNIVLNNNQVYQVTGLTKKMPDNTHFVFDYLASFNSLDLSRSEFWLSQMLETYVLLKPGYSSKALEPKFEALMDKYVMPQIKMLIPIKVNSYSEFKAMGNESRYFLEPLKEIHFNAEFMLGYGQYTDRIYIYFFSIVAVFLLFIACINFMNLSTARYSSRTKEVGVKKVLGSTQSLLVRQFLTESFFITIVAVLLSFTLIELLIPVFNNFTGKTLSIGYLSHWYTFPVIILLTIIIGLLSGLYPAYYLSSFKPVEIMKSRFNNKTGNIKLRSALVIAQFVITIMLISGTLVVSSQLKFIRNKNLGFDKNNVLIVRNTGDLGESSESFRQEVLKTKGVEKASRSWTFPGDAYNGSTYQIQGDSLDKMYHFEIIQGDYDFIPTLGMQVIKGRNFSRDYATDVSAVLINERAVKFLGLKDPVGARLTTPNDKGGMDVLEIIGIFKDVYYKSLHEKIEPSMISLNTNVTNGYTIIRLNGEDIEGTIKRIEKKWNEFLPEQAFDYTFIDKNFETLYKSEMRAGSLFMTFAGLAVFIACLGLLGLSAFTAARRTKEIGIRKVNGASVTLILRLLTREIVLLISVSSLIAWPACYLIMQKWLEQFAYRTNINPVIFPVSTGIALLIAIAVVVQQSMRAARINPVEALKYE